MKQARGRVHSRARNGLYILPDNGDDLHFCRIPSRGKRSKIAMPVPGDWVLYDPPEKTTDGWIRKIETRTSCLRRYVFGRIKEIAANMDRVFLMTTISNPVVSPRLVDRLLVGASEGEMEASIIINKLDLFSKQDVEDYSKGWQKAGYQVYYMSAKSGEGIKDFETQLSGKTTLLVGASGVGKSTLLNRLIDDLDLDTSKISKATGRGVHTTTYTYLYPFPEGGIIADSPGIREFHPVLEPENLHYHFREFELFSSQCKWRNCLHLEETDCAVREAAENGTIHFDRYESYRILYESLKQGPSRGRRYSDHTPVI